MWTGWNSAFTVNAMGIFPIIQTGLGNLTVALEIELQVQNS